MRIQHLGMFVTRRIHRGRISGAPFGKYMDDPESKRLNAALDKTPCGIDVFESRASVSSAVLDSLGFEGT